MVDRLREISRKGTPKIKKLWDEAVSLRKSKNYPLRERLCRQGIKQTGDSAALRKYFYGFSEELAVVLLQWINAPRRRRNINESHALFKFLAMQKRRSKHHEAVALQGLAITNVDRAQNQGNKIRNLKKGISLYRKARKLYQNLHDPIQCARVDAGLADASRQLYEHGETRMMDLAIKSAKSALRIFSKKGDLNGVATMHFSLSEFYKLEKTKNTNENLKLSIRHAQKSLSYFSKENFTERWAIIKEAIAVNFMQLTPREQSKNLKKALRHYRDSLEVFKKLKLTEDCKRVAKAISDIQAMLVQ